MSWTTTAVGWFRYPTSPFYRGDDPFNEADDFAEVTILDGTNPEIGTLGSLVSYQRLTSEGNTVLIDPFGHIAITDDVQPVPPIPGETFDYTIDGGLIQTYTWT